MRFISLLFISSIFIAFSSKSKSKMKDLIFANEREALSQKDAPLIQNLRAQAQNILEAKRQRSNQMRFNSVQDSYSSSNNLFGLPISSDKPISTQNSQPQMNNNILTNQNLRMMRKNLPNSDNSKQTLPFTYVNGKLTINDDVIVSLKGENLLFSKSDM